VRIQEGIAAGRIKTATGEPVGMGHVSETQRFQRLGGIHAALKESGSDALFVFAGDMPLLEKEIILRQIAHFNINSCDVLIPRVNNFNEPLHAIYRKSILPMLEEYLAKNNTYALTEFCRKASTLCMQLDDSEQSRRAFTNINSPSDLNKISLMLWQKLMR